eukprot:1307105-Rhodomonas_salina.4
MQETSSHRPLDSVEGGQGPEMEQQKLRLRRPDCVLLPTDLMLGCAFVNSKLGSGALGMWGVGNDEDEQACLTVEAGNWNTLRFDLPGTDLAKTGASIHMRYP